MATILVVEDGKKNGISTASRLEKEYEVLAVRGGKEAIEVFYHRHVDLIVEDIEASDRDGYEWIRTLRKYRQKVPVIVLTASRRFSDKREGFLSGIDDYMVKPVNYEEVLWRIEALLRRAEVNCAKQIVLGDVALKADAYLVTRGEKTVRLPKKEFDLLYKLLSHPNMIFTKDQLLEDIWGYDTESGDHTVKTHVNRLRSKFGGWEEFKNITVRGLGYKAETAPAKVENRLTLTG